MASSPSSLLLSLVMLAASSSVAAALVGETCSSSAPCGGAGLRCTSCVPPPGTGPAACARTTPMDPTGNTKAALPFNRYSWLTTHNSFAVVGTRSPMGSAIIAPPNQEDAVASQLRNGVRGLMLDAYDFDGDVWLCHSFNGKCFAFTAYVPALSVLTEIHAFLQSNPAELVTVFLEDYTAPGSMAKVLSAAGLTKYLFPVDKMPPGQGDWPTVEEMVAWDQRLVVFTSKQGKQASDGLAYQWDHVVETQYGSDGLAQGGQCTNRGESRPMDSKAQSLVLMNFFTTNPSQSWACGNNSSPLIAKMEACYRASANRWPNFIAVDFYMRSSGGGAPLATDVANGRLQCGCDTVAYCRPNAPFGSCNMPSSSPSPSPSSPSPSPSLSLSPSPSPAAPTPAHDYHDDLPPINRGRSPAPSPSNGPAAAAEDEKSPGQRRQVSEQEAATATSAEAPGKAPTRASTSNADPRRRTLLGLPHPIPLLLLTTLLSLLTL